MSISINLSRGRPSVRGIEALRTDLSLTPPLHPETSNVEIVIRVVPTIRRSLVFGDIGSGCGRLVVAQALTWPWRSCRGVEIVPSLHDMGEAALGQAGDAATEDSLSSEAVCLLKTMAPCSLSLGDVNDEVYTTQARVLREERLKFAPLLILVDRTTTVRGPAVLKRPPGESVVLSERHPSQNHVVRVYMASHFVLMQSRMFLATRLAQQEGSTIVEKTTSSLTARRGGCFSG